MPPGFAWGIGVTADSTLGLFLRSGHHSVHRSNKKNFTPLKLAFKIFLDCGLSFTSMVGMMSKMFFRSWRKAPLEAAVPCCQHRAWCCHLGRLCLMPVFVYHRECIWIIIYKRTAEHLFMFVQSGNMVLNWWFQKTFKLCA